MKVLKNTKNKAVKIAIFLIALICAFGMFSVKSELLAKEDDEDFDVEIQFGYDKNDIFNSGLREKNIPIFFKLKNNTNSDIEGSIIIKIEPSNYYYGRQQELEIGFTLPAGVSKNVKMPFYTGFTGKQLSFQVVDKKGKVIYDNEQKYYDQPSDVRYIGVITEDKTDFYERYSRYGSEYVTTPLTPDFFPETFSEMDVFDMIILDTADFSQSSSFSEEQLNLLDMYIRNGGIVIAQTGGKTDECLAGIKKYFKGNYSSACNYIGKKDINIRYIDYFDTNVNLTFLANDVDICTLEDENFESFKDNIIYKHKDYNLFVTSFYLGDSGMQNISDSVSFTISSALATDYKTFTEFFESGINYDFSNYLGNDVKNRNPRGIVITAVMIIYIAGIIVTYGILRGKRKDGAMWWIIPAASVAVSLIFILYGQIIRGSGYADQITFVELKEGGQSTAYSNSYVLINKIGKHYISYEDIDDMVFIPDEDYYYSDLPKAKFVYGENAKAWYYGMQNGSSVTNTVAYTSKEYNAFNISVQTDEQDLSNLTATIENTTGKDLTDVFVLYEGNLYLIGDFKAGESVKIGKDNAINNLQDIIEEVFYEFCYKKDGYSRFEMRTDMANYLNYGEHFELLKDNEKIYKRAYSIDTINSLYKGYYSDEFCIFAFDENAGNNVKLDGKKVNRTNHDTIIYQHFYPYSSINHTLSRNFIIDRSDIVYSYSQSGMSYFLYQIPVDCELNYFTKRIVTITEYGDFVPDAQYGLYNFHELYFDDMVGKDTDDLYYLKAVDGCIWDSNCPIFISLSYLGAGMFNLYKCSGFNPNGNYMYLLAQYETKYLQACCEEYFGEEAEIESILPAEIQVTIE